MKDKEVIERLGSVNMDSVDTELSKRKSAASDRWSRIGEAIEVCMDNQEQLNDWEGDFMYDLQIRYDRKQSISEKQEQCLYKIRNKLE